MWILKNEFFCRSQLEKFLNSLIFQVLIENNYYVSKVKPGRALTNNTKTKYDKKENINPVYRDYIEKIPKEGYIKSVGKLESIFLQSVWVRF